RKNLKTIACLHVAFKEGRVQPWAGCQGIRYCKVGLHIEVCRRIPQWAIQVDQRCSLPRAGSNDTCDVHCNRCGAGSVLRGHDAVDLSALRPGLGMPVSTDLLRDVAVESLKQGILCQWARQE